MKKLIALLLVLCCSVAAITAFGEEAPEKTYADEHPEIVKPYYEGYPVLMFERKPL